MKEAKLAQERLVQQMKQSEYRIEELNYLHTTAKDRIAALESQLADINNHEKDHDKAAEPESQAKIESIQN